jgi:hypothetical protein
MQNLIQNSFIVIFIYNFQHPPTFNCVAEIVFVNFSLVSLQYFYSFFEINIVVYFAVWEDVFLSF